MKLRSVRSDCIWCGRRLIQSGFPVDCREKYGPRPRSDEHIIPENVFGKIITTDLCKCCNDHFGSVCDFALVKDKEIVEAAKRAGVKETELWPHFDAIQRTPSGREIKIAYSQGEFKPKPEFQSLEKLAVPIISGKLSEKHLKHFRARLLQKVHKKITNLPASEIQKHVEMLLDQMCQDPTKTYHDSVICETVSPTQLTDQIIYTRETKPWETQWCFAKIVFELSQLLWPKDYREYFTSVFDQWRFFLEKRECSPDGKQGIGIFLYDELPDESAAKQHLIEGIVSATEISWSLIFFGTARWKFINKVRPVHAPNEPGYCIKIVNPFGDSKTDAEIRITELE
jgi:hypothetical protein